MKSSLSAKEIDRRRARNLRQRLLVASRKINSAIVGELQHRGFGDLKSTHTSLLSNLDMEGASMSAIAKRAGMTKQAMGRLADELIGLGYIDSEPDPNDGRASILRFTASGLELMHSSFDIMADIEKRCVDMIGKQRFDVLLDALGVISEQFDDA